MTDAGAEPCCISAAHGQQCSCARGMTTIRALEIAMSRLKFTKQTADELMYHLDSLRTSRALMPQEPTDD